LREQLVRRIPAAFAGSVTPAKRFEKAFAAALQEDVE
jgi:hypothetical protein